MKTFVALSGLAGFAAAAPFFPTGGPSAPTAGGLPPYPVGTGAPLSPFPTGSGFPPLPSGGFPSGPWSNGTFPPGAPQPSSHHPYGPPLGSAPFSHPYGTGALPPPPASAPTGTAAPLPPVFKRQLPAADGENAANGIGSNGPFAWPSLSISMPTGTDAAPTGFSIDAGPGGFAPPAPSGSISFPPFPSGSMSALPFGKRQFTFPPLPSGSAPAGLPSGSMPAFPSFTLPIPTSDASFSFLTEVTAAEPTGAPKVNDMRGCQGHIQAGNHGDDSSTTTTTATSS